MEFSSFILFICLFWTLGLPCCMDFSLVAGRRGYSLVVVHRLLTAVAYLVAKQAVGCVGFSSCDMRAQ